MAKKIKTSHCGAALAKCFDQLEHHARFQAQINQNLALLPIMWSGEARKALLASELDASNEPYALTELLEQWSQSSERAKLSAELSRVLFFCPEQRSETPPEGVFPLSRQISRIPSALSGQRPSIGTPPVNDGFPKPAPKDRSEFGAWFESAQTGSELALFPLPSTDELKKFEALALESIARAMGPTAWGLVQDRIAHAEELAKPSEQRAAKSQTRETAESKATAVLSALREVAGTLKGHRGTDREAQLLQMIAEAVGLPGKHNAQTHWLSSIQADASSTWDDLRAKLWTLEAQEIWKTVRAGRPPTTAESAVLCLWPWIDPVARTAPGRGPIATVAARSRWTMPSFKIIEAAVSDYDVYVHACRKCSEAMISGCASNPDRSQTPPLERDAINLDLACQRLAPSLAREARSIALARQASWLGTLGYEEAANLVREGRPDAVSIQLLVDESASKRMARDTNFAGRLSGAIDSIHPEAEAGRPDAIKLLSTFGMDAAAIEQLAASPQSERIMEIARAILEFELSDFQAWPTFAACAIALKGDADEPAERQFWRSPFNHDELVASIEAFSTDEFFQAAISWLAGQNIETACLNSAKGLVGQNAASQAMRVAAQAFSQGPRAFRYALAQSLDLCEEDQAVPLFLHEALPYGPEGAIDYQTRAILENEGFRGRIALSIEDSGLAPSIEPGASSLSRANAWMGLGKTFLKEKFGFQENAWKAACKASEAVQSNIAQQVLQASASMATRSDVAEHAFEPLGSLMSHCAERALPLERALLASSALKNNFAQTCLAIAPSAPFWSKLFKPMETGASAPTCIELFELEENARLAKLPVLQAAFIERAQEHSQTLARDASDMSDWARDRQGRFWRELPAKFGWSALERGSKRWHEEASMRKAETGAAWPLLGIDWQAPELGLRAVELGTPRDLAEEGKAMRHCVGTYASKCQNGQSRIFSIRKDGKRLSTLELVRHDSNWSIAQNRGNCNADPGKDAERAGREILEAVSLAIAKSTAGALDNACDPSHFQWEPEGFDPMDHVAGANKHAMSKSSSKRAGKNRSAPESNEQSISTPSVGDLLLASIGSIHAKMKSSGNAR